MNIQGIDHIEFYAGDAQQHAYYLGTTFGFTLAEQAGPETGLPGQRSFLLRHGQVRLLYTSALTPDHPAADYVARHGDGVACIAFGHDDVRTAYADAVALGATPLRAPTTYLDKGEEVLIAEVSGFGDVRHRLVQRTHSTEQSLPGTGGALAEDSKRRESRLHVIDHIAVCLPSGELDPTVAYYERVFGFRQIFEEYVQVGAQAMNSKVVQSTSGQVTLTLIEPDATRAPGQIDRFLADHGGAGVQHVAFLTDDIITTVQELESHGVQFLPTVASYYDAIPRRLGTIDIPVDALRATNVLVDRDHDGELFQIFTRSMHVRGTYFMELVDRHGARTFGSGNIKALYEAVQAGESAASLDTAATTA